MKLDLAATCTFGLESVLKREIISLGYQIKSTDNGRIYFTSDELALARTNIFLRTADRVHIVLSEFPAHDFDELFDGVRSVEWENFISERGQIVVKGRSAGSKIHSVPVAQSMTKKAIIERLRERTGRNEIIEDGVLYPVEIELNNDIGRLMLNTSGEALFKRGYRGTTGDAPMKETLAAGLIMLSGWKSSEPLVDPFCGSGTIPIEAAMIKKNMAPGLNRHFLSMKWDFIDKNVWNSAASEAMDMIRSYEKAEIYGYDKDPGIIAAASANAQNAEVEDCAVFKNVPVEMLKLKGQPGVIVTNPPYGERLSDRNEAEGLYLSLKTVLERKPDWSANIITAHPAFLELFGRAEKKRKLFNGNIKCNYYSYFR